MFGLVGVAHAEKIGSKEAEEKSLKLFTDTNSKLYKASEQLKAIYMSYEGNSKRDVSKTLFIENDIRKIIDVQFNRTVTLFWSMSLALDIEKRDKLKLASAFGAICSAPSQGFDYRTSLFDRWQKLTMEAAKDEGFNKTELSVIKNTLDLYGQSLQSTHEFCNRAQNMDNW